jgi:hypothetical protein
MTSPPASRYRGKQELLIEAAMYAFARAIPADEFAALPGVEDLIGLIAAEVADRARSTRCSPG